MFETMKLIAVDIKKESDFLSKAGLTIIFLFFGLFFIILLPVSLPLYLLGKLIGRFA